MTFTMNGVLGILKPYNLKLYNFKNYEIELGCYALQVKGNHMSLMGIIQASLFP